MKTQRLSSAVAEGQAADAGVTWQSDQCSESCGIEIGWTLQQFESVSLESIQ